MRKLMSASPLVAATFAHPLVATAERHGPMRAAIAAAMVTHYTGGGVAFSHVYSPFRCARIVLSGPEIPALADICATTQASHVLRGPPPDMRTVPATVPALAVAGPAGLCAVRARRVPALLSSMAGAAAYDPLVFYTTPLARLSIVAEALESGVLSARECTYAEIPKLVLWMMSLVPSEVVRPLVRCWRAGDEWCASAYNGVLVGLQSTSGAHAAALGDPSSPLAPIGSVVALYVLYASACDFVRHDFPADLIDGLIACFIAGAIAGVPIDSFLSTRLGEVPASVRRHQKRALGKLVRHMPAAKELHVRVCAELRGAAPPSAAVARHVARGRVLEPCYQRDNPGMARVADVSKRWTTRTYTSMTRDEFVRALVSAGLYVALGDLAALEEKKDRHVGRALVYARVTNAHRTDVVASIAATVLPADPTELSQSLMAASYQSSWSIETLVAVDPDVWFAHQAVSMCYYVDPRPALGGRSYAGLEASQSSCRFVRLSQFPVVVQLWASTSPVCHLAAVSIMRKWAGYANDVDSRVPATRVRVGLVRSLMVKPTTGEASPVDVLAALVPLLAINDTADEIGTLAPVHPSIATRLAANPASVWAAYYEVCASSWGAWTTLAAAAATLSFTGRVPVRAEPDAEGGEDVHHPSHIMHQKLMSRASMPATSACVDACDSVCSSICSRSSTVALLLMGLEARYYTVAARRPWETTWPRVFNPITGHGDGARPGDYMPVLLGASGTDCYRERTWPLGALHSTGDTTHLFAASQFVVWEATPDEHTDVCRRWVDAVMYYGSRITSAVFAGYGTGGGGGISSSSGRRDAPRRTAAATKAASAKHTPPRARAKAAAAAASPAPVLVVHTSRTTTTTTYAPSGMYQPTGAAAVSGKRAGGGADRHLDERGAKRASGARAEAVQATQSADDVADALFGSVDASYGRRR